MPVKQFLQTSNTSLPLQRCLARRNLRKPSGQMLLVSSRPADQMPTGVIQALACGWWPALDRRGSRRGSRRNRKNQKAPLWMSTLPAAATAADSAVTAACCPPM